jgi:hypothetical protein
MSEKQRVESLVESMVGLTAGLGVNSFLLC